MAVARGHANKICGSIATSPRLGSWVTLIALEIFMQAYFTLFWYCSRIVLSLRKGAPSNNSFDEEAPRDGLYNTAPA